MTLATEAYEEGRHWLEGTRVPFVVWTDHRNLEYIQSTMKLNSRQARWSPFFDLFNFTLSYRPGSCNVKPDALSRQYPECPDETVEPSTGVPAPYAGPCLPDWPEGLALQPRPPP